MATTTLGQDNFETTINEHDIVLVDWWASWCGPCRMFAPIFEKASEEHTDIVFGKIDTEAERGLSAAAGITSIPTLMAFKDGSLVFAQPGALPAPALAELIQAVRDLDIDAARKAADEREADDVTTDEVQDSQLPDRQSASG
jgi:thioredoxin 1